MSEVEVVEAGSSSKRKCSGVFKYFDRSCAASLNCLVRGAILKTPTNTTTPLLNHLKRHPGARKEYESAAAAAEQRNAPKSKNASVMPAFKPRLNDQSVRARALTKKIGCFIATGLHSYTVVEEPAFLELMKCAVPEYNVPSRTTFSRTVVPEMYDAARYALHTLLHSVLRKDVGCIAVTTDGWTSRAGDSFVSVTCHVLSEDFVPYSFVLACRCMRERHTAENLRSLIEDVFEEWGIPLMLSCFVVTFLRLPKRCEHNAYFAHTLQLCVQDAKKETKGFTKVCAKVRAIVGHYKRSSSARARLQDIQKRMGIEVPLELVQDVPTRWNSEYAMLARLLKLKAAVALDLAETDTVENLTTDEWRLVTALVSVLQPIEEATTAACAESFPTLSMVIPLVHCVKMLLSEGASGTQDKAFSQNLLRSVKTRFLDASTQAPHALATFLDPRFKDICYNKEEKENVESLLSTMLQDVSDSTQLTSEESDAEQQSQTSEQPSLWKILNSLASSKKNDAPSFLMQEVYDYLQSPVLPRTDSPFHWWQTVGKEKYKTLACAARQYLAIPATQVASERLFSTCSNTVTSRRESLAAEHLEKLVFLHGNYKYLKLT